MYFFAPLHAYHCRSIEPPAPCPSLSVVCASLPFIIVRQNTALFFLDSTPALLSSGLAEALLPLTLLHSQNVEKVALTLSIIARLNQHCKSFCNFFYDVNLIVSYVARYIIFSPEYGKIHSGVMQSCAALLALR